MSKSENDPLISVIVPIYNVEKYLPECLESIINQSYKNLEILLIDDGSTDRCGEICKSYAKKDKRIFIISQTNQGLSEARNVGIRNAKGKYLYFADSDDYLALDAIEMLYQAAVSTSSDLTIAGHTVVYEGKGLEVFKEPYGKSPLSAKDAIEIGLYDKGIEFSAWNKLYHQKLFKNITFPKRRLFEDVATVYKCMLKSNKIAIIHQSLYFYRKRNDSISNRKFDPSKMDLIVSTEEMCQEILKKYPDLEKACQRRQMFAYLSTLSQMACCKERYRKEETFCMNYVKIHSKELLNDKDLPTRDRFALVILKFGYLPFRFCWNVYRRLSGRK